MKSANRNDDRSGKKCNGEDKEEGAMMEKGISRRGFLSLGAIAGAAVAAAGLTGCSPKVSSGTSADSTATAASGGTYAFETAPDAIPESQIAATESYDVVVVGGSSTGLCATAAAAEEGAKVICIEKTDKAQGAGTYYGFINTKLLAANGMAAVDEGAYADKLIEASLGACDPTLAHTYAHHAGAVGDWLADIATSTGNKALFSTATGSENTTYFDDAASGSSIYNALTIYGTSKGATYVYSTEVVRLERDDGGRATGVIAKGADGSYTRYQASKGVVLATGAYNGDQDMVRKYIPWLDLDTTDEYSPLANNGNTGDGLKMALWTGARIGSVPHCPMVHFIKGAMPMAGSLFVNGAGRRFMDEGTSMEVIAQTVMRQPGHAMYQVGDAKPSGMALLMMSMGASSGADASAAGTSGAVGASGAAGASGATGAAASGMAGASGAAASGAGAAGASGATGASGSAGAGSASSAATAGTSGAAGASGSSSGSGNGAADPSANLGGSGETYNSLDELAAAYDMDAAVLKQTVERWNELVTKGVDEDFGSNFKIAQTIDTPPYSITASPGCRLAMIGGPQVDANLAVLDDDYKPIPGLYAAGNCTCGFYGPNYPMQVQDGIARAFSTVSGYLAAKNAIAG